MAMRNIRFWVFTNNGPVKLTLKPGQKLSHYQAEPTDEGWSSQYDSWEYVAPDGYVLNEFESDGVDCDGRLSRGGYRACMMDDLDSGAEFDGVQYPAWQRYESWQRDYQAEAAGY